MLGLIAVANKVAAAPLESSYTGYGVRSSLGLVSRDDPSSALTRRLLYSYLFIFIFNGTVFLLIYR